MDQKKIGSFLKELRLSKQLTQEALAQEFYVSPRTISRWETGVNLPDICLLIKLADFYQIDVREIIEGGHTKTVNDNERDMAIKVANYSNDKNVKTYKNIFKAGIFSLIAITLFLLLVVLFDDVSYTVVEMFKGFFIGACIVINIYITIYSSGLLIKIHKIKWLKTTLTIIVLLCLIAVVFYTFYLIGFLIGTLIASTMLIVL